MHAWRTAFDKKLKHNVHELPPGIGHALLSPVVAGAFQRLGVMASLWAREHDWYPLHTAPSPLVFELEHGRDADRNDYNQRALARAVASNAAVSGQFGGFCDSFVPVTLAGRVAGVLVTGPFMRERPNAARIVESWGALTGRKAHLSDPAFAAYLDSVLSILVLEGDAFDDFERLMRTLARLMSGEARADTLANEAQALIERLTETRIAESMWSTVQTMVDARTALRWSTAGRAPELRQLGLTRSVSQVLVGFAVTRGRAGDPIDDAIRRDAFQRRMVAFARRRGDTLAGRLGEHAVVFLCGTTGSAAARRESALELAEHAARIARRDFGCALYFGSAWTTGATEISRSYEQAVAAAARALERGARLESSESRTAALQSLRDLREELGHAQDEHAQAMSVRFDRYLEAVAVHAGYRVEAARGHLEAGFERLASPLRNNGSLDAKSFDALCDSLDRRALEAHSLDDLFAAYRRAVLDLAEAIQKPVVARHDRSLRHAIDHIHAHYAAPLRLAQVAKIAGLSPSHFSKLFIARERMPFETYLRGLRLERAKQLLFDTDLPSTRISELCGFGSQQYFATVFRRVFGKTPLQYRREHPMIRHRLRNKN